MHSSLALLPAKPPSGHRGTTMTHESVVRVALCPSAAAKALAPVSLMLFSQRLPEQTSSVLPRDCMSRHVTVHKDTR
jgi:hypothetical protein